jgi:hypothetical protein
MIGRSSMNNRGMVSGGSVDNWGSMDNGGMVSRSSMDNWGMINRSSVVGRSMSNNSLSAMKTVRRVSHGGNSSSESLGLSGASVISLVWLGH